MDKLLKFMDFSCIDPKLYWKVPSLDGQNLYEIQWCRDDKIHWRFRKQGELFWELSSEDGILSQLEAQRIDLGLFEIELRSTILQQVSYADRIVRDARSLFGSETVDEAIIDQQNFLSQLEQTIADLTQLPSVERPMLRMIKAKEEIVQN